MEVIKQPFYQGTDFSPYPNALEIKPARGRPHCWDFHSIRLVIAVSLETNVCKHVILECGKASVCKSHQRFPECYLCCT